MNKYISFFATILLLFVIPDFAFAYIAVSNGYIEKGRAVKVKEETPKENFIANAKANYYLHDEYSKEHTNMLTLSGEQNRT